MMFGKLFQRRPSTEMSAQAVLDMRATDEGVSYAVAGADPSEWLLTPYQFGQDGALLARLAMLYEDGIGLVEGNCFLLPWEDLYAVLQSPDRQWCAGDLGLPPLVDHRPELTNRGSIGDADFSVLLQQWVDGAGAPLKSPPKLTGALLEMGQQRGLLQPKVWALVQQLRAFHATPLAERDEAFRERAWGVMRREAQDSHAPMSDYLDKTVIVTADKLRLNVRAGEAGSTELMEVIPDFDGAPKGWLKQFDAGPVQSRYSVPDGPRLTKVLLSDDAKAVLQEIKRMPGRRVAGARAQAFVRNPLALLGPEAAKVLDPEQVETALAEAGITLQRFQPRLHRRADRSIEYVELQVMALSGDKVAEALRLEQPSQLQAFCDRLAARLDAQMQCCTWEGCELELTGESLEHLRQLRGWLQEWVGGSLLTAAEVLDLSLYSDRVSGIGDEGEYVVPVVGRRSVEFEWFVENVLFGLKVQAPGGQPEVVHLGDSDLDIAATLLEEAKQTGASTVTLPQARHPMPIADLERALLPLQEARRALQQSGRFDPKSTIPGNAAGIDERPTRQHLVLKSNLEEVDHLESRADQLSLPTDAQPRLPQSLRDSAQLKPHQIHGVAWLQHLWEQSPHACRGALLADDMGLGKTLQLLTFISAAIEADPSLEPVLVVAPLALLENWRAELERFFEPGTIRMLTLYGPTLRSLRVSRTELDPQLTELGVTRLLRKDWRGNANLVLTTYETMRDLEFSLAAQPWSIMVCDEAQKIKVPGAMVTRTAKKQRVRFKIACTGTPVENTLMDLWCLFDFIQPGLLGALNGFSRTYRKPIEAKTEEQKARVAELRALIEPQILRRTKQEVARDILPVKREDTESRNLPMSQRQLELYRAALAKLQRERAANPSAQLLTLQHIRRICSDPHWQASTEALRLPLAAVLQDSPKMAWLVALLEQLRQKPGPGEKVIVFCEFRDLQLLLQRVIAESLQLHPSIVNGDTSASLEAEQSRQKLIDRFQQRPGFNVIILSPLAVGFGMNIQAANHVVHFTRTWNPAKEDQATDRAYRIGQQRDVTVYYPSVTGPDFKSFDTVLHELLEWKRGIAGDMLNGAGELAISDFDALTAA